MGPSALAHGLYSEAFLWPCFGVSAILASLVLSVVALVTAVRSRRRLRDLEKHFGKAPPQERAAPVPPPAPAVPAPLERMFRPQPPAPPVVPPARAAPEIAPAPGKKFRLEEAIGLKVFAWVGVIAILIGASLFVKYAYDQGWFGRHPWIRVVIPTVFGLALLGAGEVFAHKAYRALARVSTGGGVAALYWAAFTAWARFEQPLISEPVAWAFMAVITVAAILLSVRYASLTIALFSLVGGLVAPVLISPARDPGHTLFLYMLGVNAGVLALAYWKKWRVLNVLALVGTIANLSFWLTKHYWHGETAVEKLPFIVAYLTIFWFVYFLLGIVYHLLGRRDPSRLDLPVTMINIVWYFSILYALLRADYHYWLGPAAAILGAVYLAQGLAIRRWAPKDARLVLLQVAQALGLLTLAIPIQLEGIWIPMAWAAEATILVWLGCRLKDWKVRAVGLMVHAASIVALAWFADEAWDTKGMLVLNARTATFAAVGLALALSAWLHRRLERRPAVETVFMTLAAGAAHAILMILILVETHRWFTDAEAALRPTDADWWVRSEHLRWIRDAASAILLAGYGCVAVGLVAVLRRAFHHAMALVAFVAAFVVLASSMEHMPELKFVAGWNEVGAAFASVAGWLALAAIVAYYATGRMRSGRPMAVSYELLALGVVLWLYATEVFRSADHMSALGESLPESSWFSLMAAGFAIYAGLLLARGLWIRSLAHRVAGLACVGVAGLIFFGVATEARTTYDTVLWQPRGVAMLLLAASLAIGVLAYGRRLPKASRERLVVGSILAVLLHLVVLGCFTLEAQDFWEVRAERWFPGAEMDAWYARQATLSVGYALYALALLAVGMVRRRALLRWLALGILVGTIVKVFVYDLSKVEAIWRILSFLGLGLLLLAGSLLYHKYRRVLFGNPADEPAKKEASDDQA
ncbi:MAG TPA: DUF2339 domain-containing protein [Phycisphaerae bacterium]|nr:DUF2339 domain-containing protein [Phycisphaerae bacterium]